MVRAAARIGSALGAAAAFAIAMARGGLSAWTTGALTAGALALVAVVLFIPSETPARRLGQLIQAWRIPTGAPEGATDSEEPRSSRL
ncbi:hypothetical protein GCM10022295_28570 [Streptomyces osmaniensis]|uniref:Major facilitator superfamily (MFS) profile domain-containing protein n=1 Tax=Streptomyces osmaniensis TaxID=593134 RepID=A0ABP6W5L5_9ACTN